MCFENNEFNVSTDLNSDPTDKKEFFCALIVLVMSMFIDLISLELKAAAFSVLSNLKIDFLGVGVGVLMIDWMFFIKVESFLGVFVVGDIIVGVLVDVPFVVDGIFSFLKSLDAFNLEVVLVFNFDIECPSVKLGIEMFILKIEN